MAPNTAATLNAVRCSLNDGPPPGAPRSPTDPKDT